VGVCINILDIPLLEDKACRAKREQNANERKATKQQERTERKQIEEESDVVRTIARNADGTTPLEGVLNTGLTTYGSVASSVLPLGLGVATGGLSAIPSAIGGLLGSVGDTLGLTDPETEEVDLFPVVLAVGAGVVLLMVLSDDGKGRR
jgi:hypothetical protein